MRILAYTPPSRGHLTPMMGPLLELRRRGAEVHVRTLAVAVDAVRAAGLEAAPISPAIEELALDDHEASSQITAGARTFATLRNRAGHEVADLEAALDSVAPDVVLIDAATLGAQALAERRGLRWAVSRPWLLEEATADGTPFGFGLQPQGPPLGPLRNRALGLLAGCFHRVVSLPAVNAARAAAGLPPLRRAAELSHRAPLTLYFTSVPFDYPRRLPPSVVSVGPSLWDPATADTVELPAGNRPLVLVGCSSEFQDDGAIAAAALAGLRDRYRLVVTTAGVDPAALGRPRRRAGRPLPPARADPARGRRRRLPRRHGDHPEGAGLRRAGLRRALGPRPARRRRPRGRGRSRDEAVAAAPLPRAPRRRARGSARLPAGRGAGQGRLRGHRRRREGGRRPRSPVWPVRRERE